MANQDVYDGSSNDPMKNPICALLAEYKEMSEGEIKSHIIDWWYGIDENNLFKQARDSGLITMVQEPRLDTFWKLANQA